MELLQGPLSDFYTRHPVLATILFAAVCLLIGSFLWWLLMYYPSVKAAPFRVRFHNALTFTYPGVFVYVYHSKIGRRIAPIGLAVALEVINNRSTIAKIHDYRLEININREWRRLPNLRALNATDFYWAVNSDPRTYMRLDLTTTGFDFQARRTNLPPGDSVKGWMFFEWPPELRHTGTAPFGKLRIQIENAQGERQTEPLNTEQPQDDGSSSALGGGSLPIFSPQQNTDLSGVPILPHMDLLRGLQDGTIR